MNFYSYKKDTLSYKKINFKFKYIFLFIVIQLTIIISSFFLITPFYEDSNEKKLKNDLNYMIKEFSNVNERIIESDLLLQKVVENDSIIYKIIFETDVTNIRGLNSYYDIGEDINDYYRIVENTNNKISVINQQIEKELYSLNLMIDKAYSHEDRLSHIPAIQPIDNKNLKRTASGWGWRIHPIYKIKKFHYGLDFTAKINTPIYATADGKILYTIKATNKASKGYGNLIIINHGYGYKTLYAHLNKFNVKQGQEIKRGEIIGFVGTTGLSTGPHLHYEVIKNGKKINPINFFFNSLSIEEYHKIVRISNSIKKSYD